MPDAPETIDPVPEPPPGRHLRARDALLVVGMVVALLVVFEGSSIEGAGEEMEPGIARDLVLIVGEPAAWVADQLPLAEVVADATDWIGENESLGEEGGFDAEAPAAGGGATDGGAAGGGAPGAVVPVTADAFDPVELGGEAEPPRELAKVLVTGDSLAMPLDVEVARGLADDGVEVLREPHLGTGVSKSGFVDWGKLSTQQARSEEPDATVVFIGANEGFAMPGPDGRAVECCGPEWAAAYANRVRRMMDTYRQRGDARVYWLTLPLPRDRDRQEVARAVNAAIEVAAVPYRAQVRVLDMEELFTPDGEYRSAMTVDGEREIVREPDGIHLSGDGSAVAAEVVLDAIRADFGD